jgi:hypothetical protein
LFFVTEEKAMRILDERTGQPVNDITIFLTVEEATTLYHSAQRLVFNPRIHHVHIRDEDKQRQIAVAIYTPSRVAELDERSQRLIVTGE